MAPMAKQADPVQQVFENLAATIGPAIQALVEYFRLAGGATDLVKRIAEAQKREGGMSLSADEVKTLCILLKGLSEGKK